MPKQIKLGYIKPLIKLSSPISIQYKKIEVVLELTEEQQTIIDKLIYDKNNPPPLMKPESFVILEEE